MLSISFGSMSLIERSTPSTCISGEEFSHEPLPRTKMLAASLPGSPDIWTVVTPESCPASTLLIEDTGVRTRSSLFTDERAPVTVTFFCVP